MIPYLGETLSLITAITWAIAVILFKKSGESVHPIALNLFKDLLAVMLLIPTIYLFGQSLLYPASGSDYLILFISGALGIGIADTLFFKSLNLLGAGLVAIVDCLYSPFIIILSILFLGEDLSLIQVLGVLMILSAVLTITRPRGKDRLSRRNLLLGILFGALAMAATAAGIVMVKPLLERSPLIWVTEMRLISGVLMLALILLFHRGRRDIIKSIHSVGRWHYTLIGSFFGAYLAMIFWLGGMKYTQASISASLNQTNNIFIFIFAGIFLKESMDSYKIIAIILAVAGAIVVTFS
ncbi:MAG: DMT family transporter [candidate division Zixibacteria bacterium]|nr:DMT family transporter [candidate division Zixibacteria bacterium]